MQNCKGFETVAVAMRECGARAGNAAFNRSAGGTKDVGRIIALVGSKRMFLNGGISVCAATNSGGRCEHP